MGNGDIGGNVPALEFAGLVKRAIAHAIETAGRAAAAAVPQAS